MNSLTKYFLILSFSCLTFMKVSSAAHVEEFFQDVEAGQANIDRNLFAELVARSSPGVVRHRIVTFDVNALHTDHRFEEDEIGFAWCLDEKVRMTLFPGESIVVKNKRILQSGMSEKWTWVGKIEDEPNSLVMLTFDETSSQVFGTIDTGVDVYELRPINNGYHLLQKANRNRPGLINDMDVDFSSDENDSNQDIFLADAAIGEELALFQSESGGGLVTIMIRAFTTGTWVNTPGESLFSAESIFWQGIVQFTEALAFSGINNLSIAFDPFLVDAHHINEKDPQNFNISSSQYFLNQIKNDIDPAIRNWRNDIAADLMMGFFINSSSIDCGRAQIARTSGNAKRAYSVVGNNCTIAFLTESVAHEITHNLGSAHEGTTDGIFPYSYPWIGIPPGGSELTGTVGASGNCNCNPRLKLFSAPPVFGVAELQDNTRTIKETMSMISGYRILAIPPPIPQIISLSVQPDHGCSFLANWTRDTIPFTVNILTVNGAERYRGADMSTKFSTTNGSQVSVKACIGTECGTPQTRTATCYSGGGGGH